MKKIIIIFTLIILYGNLVFAQSDYNIECKAKIVNDTLKGTITINMPNREIDSIANMIVLNMSDWVFTTDGDVNLMSMFLPKAYLLNRIAILPDDFESPKILEVVDLDISFEYNIPFLPKLFDINNQRPYEINFKYSKLSEFMDIDTSKSYHLKVMLCYSNYFDLTEFLLQNDKFTLNNMNPNGIEIDMKKMAIKPFKNNAELEFYTDIKLSECDSKILRLCFLKYLECECEIER